MHSAAAKNHLRHSEATLVVSKRVPNPISYAIALLRHHNHLSGVPARGLPDMSQTRFNQTHVHVA